MQTLLQASDASVDIAKSGLADPNHYHHRGAPVHLLSSSTQLALAAHGKQFDQQVNAGMHELPLDIAMRHLSRDGRTTVMSCNSV